jgi:hypothetical protein
MKNDGTPVSYWQSFTKKQKLSIIWVCLWITGLIGAAMIPYAAVGQSLTLGLLGGFVSVMSIVVGVNIEDILDL